MLEGLDVLRISVQKAEQEGHELVSPPHVRLAQSQLEYDQSSCLEDPSFAPKLVLFSIKLNEENGLRNISTEKYSGHTQMPV